MAYRKAAIQQYDCLLALSIIKMATHTMKGASTAKSFPGARMKLRSAMTRQQPDYPAYCSSAMPLAMRVHPPFCTAV